MFRKLEIYHFVKFILESTVITGIKKVLATIYPFLWVKS